MSIRFAWLLLISLSIQAVCPAPALTQGRRNAPVALPDGPGKEIVQNVCAQCHGLSMVTNDGYSREEWPRIFGTMVDLPKQQADLVCRLLLEKKKNQQTKIHSGDQSADDALAEFERQTSTRRLLTAGN